MLLIEYRDEGELDVALDKKWDFNRPTGIDNEIIDKALLPKVMQVKVFLA